MKNNLDILYKIQELIQSSLDEHYDESLAASLELLTDLISDTELLSIETEVDDETNIPTT